MKRRKSTPAASSGQAAARPAQVARIRRALAAMDKARGGQTDDVVGNFRRTLAVYDAAVRNGTAAEISAAHRGRGSRS
jgi:hypothetical protein